MRTIRSHHHTLDSNPASHQATKSLDSPSQCQLKFLKIGVTRDITANLSYKLGRSWTKQGRQGFIIWKLHISIWIYVCQYCTFSFHNYASHFITPSSHSFNLILHRSSFPACTSIVHEIKPSRCRMPKRARKWSRHGFTLLSDDLEQREKRKVETVVIPFEAESHRPQQQEGKNVSVDGEGEGIDAIDQGHSGENLIAGISQLHQS